MRYALDCEMVSGGNRSILAKVSIVDERGHVVLNKIVKPQVTVTDYRTEIHGLTANDLAGGEYLYTVREEVISILRGNILVGHSLKFDLEALNLTCDSKQMRDLAEYPPLQYAGQALSLRQLAANYLRRRIQIGIHDSVEDAKAAMDIYWMFAIDWEKSI